MLRLLIFTLVCMGLLRSPASAQTHLAPQDGALGVPGPIIGSFVISWEEIPTAIAYEYVMSDNSQCFAGCAGDTRQEKVNTTSALEYDLRGDANYYWITRVFFVNGDTSGWSKISSFLAVSPLVGEPLTLFPNPIRAETISYLRVDWGAINGGREVWAQVIDPQGRDVTGKQRFERSELFARFEDFPFDLSMLASGMYYAVLQIGEADGEKFIIPFLILEK